MDDLRAEVPKDTSDAFTEVSQGARLLFHAVRSCGDPRDGSNFAKVNAYSPYEKVSDRARHYVHAALEHLNMWADHAAPLKFHEEHRVVFWMRPTYALARAALETAAQAVWLMDTDDYKTCVQRHLQLIRWDLAEHRKSRLTLDGKQPIKQRDADLLKRVKDVFSPEEIKPPKGYGAVIRDACRPADLELDADDAERIWRAASGAAHGMYWTNLDLQEVSVGPEYEPGFYRSQSFPRVDLMLEALRAAETMTLYAGGKYILWSGYSTEELMTAARRWLSDNITFKPGTTTETITRLRGNGIEQTDEPS